MLRPGFPERLQAGQPHQRQHAAVAVAQAGWQQPHLVLIRDHTLGIGAKLAAAQQPPLPEVCPHLVAYLEPGAAGARGDLASYVKPEDVREAQPHVRAGLNDLPVDRVDRRGVHPDQHLPLARRRRHPCTGWP